VFDDEDDDFRGDEVDEAGHDHDRRGQLVRVFWDGVVPTGKSECQQKESDECYQASKQEHGFSMEIGFERGLTLAHLGVLSSPRGSVL